MAAFCFSEGLAYKDPAFLWKSLPPVTSRACDHCLALTLTLAAWGSAAASLCANIKENAHRGLRDTQSNQQFVVLRKTTLESQRMENRKSMECEDWAKK